jgi:threonine synthase
VVTATPVSDWAARLGQAREAVAAALPPTPLIASPGLGEGVLLKVESFQPTGSFKVRGALAALTAAGNPGGVVTASTGNHALGVAWAARRAGIPATVVVPATASPAKLTALQRTEESNMATEIAGISGSLRRGSVNRMLLRAAGQVLPPGAELEIWDHLDRVPPFK